MRQLIHLASHRYFQWLHRQPQQDSRSPFNQWMNPIQLSVLFFLLSGSHALFAADINSKSSQSILDLIGVIMWGIAVPALVIGGIGLGIYAWIRRNKSSLSPSRNFSFGHIVAFHSLGCFFLKIPPNIKAAPNVNCCEDKGHIMFVKIIHVQCSGSWSLSSTLMFRFMTNRALMTTKKIIPM